MLLRRRNSARQTGHHPARKYTKAGLPSILSSVAVISVPSASLSANSGARLPTSVPTSAWGAGVGVGSGVGVFVGTGVVVAVGAGVGVSVGCGVGVAGTGVGVSVGCGVGVAVGAGVAVGSCGTGVAVGTGTGVSAARVTSAAVDVAVGVGTGVSVGAGAGVSGGRGTDVEVDNGRGDGCGHLRGLSGCGGRGGCGCGSRPAVGEAAQHLGPLIDIPPAEPVAVRDHARAVDGYLRRLLQNPKIGDGLAHRVGDFVDVTLAGLQVLQLVWRFRRVDADTVELDPVRKLGIDAAQAP